MFEETNAYSASIVGEWETHTTGESVNSLPHAPWVCVLSVLVLSLSSSLNELIFKPSRILFLNKTHRNVQQIEDTLDFY